MKVNLMKIIFIAFGFTMLYALTQFNSPGNKALTEATISISNLSEANYQYIKKDLIKIRGISFCDVSLISNMVNLKINDSIVSEKQIETILRKWGCSIIESSYIRIATFVYK